MPSFFELFSDCHNRKKIESYSRFLVKEIMRITFIGINKQPEPFHLSKLLALKFKRISLFSRDVTSCFLECRSKIEIAF